MTLRGINYRNVNDFAGDALEILQACSSEAVVVLSTSPAMLPHLLRDLYPRIQIIGRLFRGGPYLPTPEDAVSDWREYIRANTGFVDLWQVDNEPDENYPDVSSEDFSTWWIRVLGLLRAEFPNQLWGFPMPSVQGIFSWFYALQCEDCIFVADWVAERSYWSNQEGIDHDLWGNRFIRLHERWPNKAIHLCEYGNSNPLVDPMVKAHEYATFQRELPSYIESAHPFIMAGAPDWDAKGFGVTLEMAKIINQSPIGQDEGGIMDDADRKRLWADYMQFPAFDRFRGDHSELGDASEPRERTYGDYRVKFYAGGIIGCKVGDWANIEIWNSLEDIPLPL